MSSYEVEMPGSSQDCTLSHIDSVAVGRVWVNIFFETTPLDNLRAIRNGGWRVVREDV